MKTLVTGATGFVGSAVARALLAQGTRVRVATRKGSDTRNLDGLDVEVAHADVRDPQAMRGVMKGCNRLFHVAAYFAHWAPDPRPFYETNVEGTRAVLEAALAEGLEKVVYTSTANCFGAHGAGNLTDEAGAFNEQDIGDHYAVSKYLGEQEALKLVPRGLPLVIVNPTLVIGPHDARPTPSGKLIVDIANQEMPGYIEGATNLIDVDDVARGHLLAAARGRVGERYILGNANVTVTELFKLVADAAGVAAPRLKLPYPVALALGAVFEAGAWLTKHPPLITRSQVIIGKMGEHFSNAKAVKELGLSLTPLDVTIRRTLEWFDANGFIKRKR
jgi:dihydroflavonol-4-reductase